MDLGGKSHRFEPPAFPVAKLLRGTGGKSAAFKQNLRRYNMAMSFASFGDSKGERSSSHRSGHAPPVYIMHGHPYHSLSTLYPSDGQEKYGQLYIFDPDEDTDAVELPDLLAPVRSLLCRRKDGSPRLVVQAAPFAVAWGCFWWCVRACHLRRSTTVWAIAFCVQC